MFCYFCQTEYSYKYFNSEHIIPQALGGTLQSNKIICSGCNSRYGKTIDDALINNFKHVASALNVHRDRRRNPNIPVKNQEGIFKYQYIVGKGLKRLNEIEKISDKSYLFSGYSKEYLISKVEQFSKKKKKKFEILESTDLDYQLDFSWELNTGSIEVLRSLYKSSLLYYLYEGLDSKCLGIKYSFCDGAAAGVVIYPYLNPPNLLPPFSNENVYHSINIISSSKDNKIYALITLFSTFNYLAHLNFNYNGEKVCIGYRQNVFSGKIEKQNLEWQPKEEKLTKDEYKTKIFENQKPLNHLLFEKYSNNMLNKPLVRDFMGIPKGTIINSSHIEKIYKSVFKILEIEIQEKNGE